jgi:vacuolar-type H+-ATPase subunit H
VSDVLKKLMDKEKEIAELINNAEEEAQKRIGRARNSARQKANELVQNKAAELEEMMNKRKEELLLENKKENEKYQEELNKIPVRKDNFKKKVLEFLKKTE